MEYLLEFNLSWYDTVPCWHGLMVARVCCNIYTFTFSCLINHSLDMVQSLEIFLPVWNCHNGKQRYCFIVAASLRPSWLVAKVLR